MPAAERFIAFHRNLCAMCGVAPLEIITDHDHATGLVRGYLCPGCNTAEGKPGRLSAAIVAGYRERHPSAILGHREKWGSPTAVLMFPGRRRSQLIVYVGNHGERLDRTLDQMGRHIGWAGDLEPKLRHRELGARALWSAAIAGLAADELLEAERSLEGVRFNLDMVWDVAGAGPLRELAAEGSGRAGGVLAAVRRVLELRTESGNDT
jgi:hypothetical protein